MKKINAFRKLRFLSLMALLGCSRLAAQSPPLQWVRTMGGTDEDFVYSIALDASGNVYATGSFKGTADFDPGTGVTNLVSLGQSDIFISKLDASGNLVWAKSIGGNSFDEAYAIVSDVNGDVYVTGGFSGTADFDPGAGTTYLTANGSTDVFILKLSAAGNFVWAKSIGGTNYEYGNAITIDPMGNSFVIGYFNGTVDFDPGAGSLNIASNGNADIYILKLDGSGNLVWAKTIGGTNDEYAYDLSTDAVGSIYYCATFQNTVDFDPGAATYTLSSTGSSGFDDPVISKLDGSGNFVWARSISGANYEAGMNMTRDLNGNIFLTGTFESTADFDPGAATFNLTSNGSEDAFILKLDASGNFVWAKNFGGTGSDIGLSIAPDAAGNIFTSGFFMGTVDFDPGTGTYNATSSGQEDAFVSKFDGAGNFMWTSTFGGTSSESILSMVVTSQSDIYTAGMFNGTCDFDPNAGIANLTSAGMEDIFIHKMNASITGLSQADMLKTISIYPNPTTGIVNIRTQNEEDVFSITLVNVTGQVVYQKNIERPSDLSLDLSLQPKGIYSVEVRKHNSVERKLLVKE